MKYSIFIRSWKGDIEWLSHALKSIHKYQSGWQEIVVVVPENQLELFKKMNLTAETLKSCPVYQNDYIGQQLTKLEAYKYTDADIITFWDSDVIAFNHLSPEDYIIDGKPIIYRTNYQELKGNQGYAWKAITEKAIGYSVDFEYMRRLPLTYHRSTLEDLHLYFKTLHGITPQEYVKTITNKDFSEFNLVGAYAEKFEADKYTIIDTSTVALPTLKAKQFWSWGGITPEIKKEINNFV